LPAQRIANPYRALLAQCSIPVHGFLKALGFAALYTDAIGLKFHTNPLLALTGLGCALAAALLLAGGTRALAKDPIPLPRPRPLGLDATPMIPLPPLRPSIPPTVETPEPLAPSACQLRSDGGYRDRRAAAADRGGERLRHRGPRGGSAP